MSDKESIQEAVKLLKRRNKLVKKSLAGIGRLFEYDMTEPKGLTYPKAEDREAENKQKEEQKKEEEKKEEEKKEEEKEEEKPKTIEEVINMFEPKPKKYRIKRNSMIVPL